MSKFLGGVLALLFFVGAASAARADSALNSGPPTISVSATGSVDFVPDIAQLTLGIRIEAPTAQAATNTVNQRASQVIAALRSTGIKNRSIKTTSYTLEYNPPQDNNNNAGYTNEISPAPPGPKPGIPARMPPHGKYVASETLEVTAPVGLAGKVLDAAIAAGANESFGLSYQTSNAQALYREALAKAISAARESAQSIAAAAHVNITGIQSISTNATPTPVGGVEPMMARNTAAASVMPGTEAITATVFIVYKI